EIVNWQIYLIHLMPARCDKGKYSLDIGEVLCQHRTREFDALDDNRVLTAILNKSLAIHGLGPCDLAGLIYQLVKRISVLTHGFYTAGFDQRFCIKLDWDVVQDFSHVCSPFSWACLFMCSHIGSSPLSGLWQ